MILNYAAIVVLVLSVVLQAAVLRAPETAEVLGGSRRARRVLIVGLLLCAVYVADMTYSGLKVDALVAWGLLLIAMAEVTFCINRLFPTALDEIGEELAELVSHHDADHRKPRRGSL